MKKNLPQAQPKRKLVVFALYMLGKAKIMCMFTILGQ
jgi:hypothetical protein